MNLDDRAHAAAAAVRQAVERAELAEVVPPARPRRHRAGAGVAVAVSVLAALAVVAGGTAVARDVPSSLASLVSPTTTPPTTAAPPPASEQLCAVPAPRPGRGERTVTAFLTCSDSPAPPHVATVPVRRVVPKTRAVLRASLQELLEGPTEQERAAGLGSWFSARTEGQLRRVSVDGRGRAVVDFGDLLAHIDSNARTSEGGGALLSELNATVFQFPNVTSVTYRVDGDARALCRYLESTCTSFSRADWEEALREVRDV